jgi:hypothetical protein
MGHTSAFPPMPDSPNLRVVDLPVMTPGRGSLDGSASGNDVGARGGVLSGLGMGLEDRSRGGRDRLSGSTAVESDLGDRASGADSTGKLDGVLGIVDVDLADAPIEDVEEAKVNRKVSRLAKVENPQ